MMSIALKRGDPKMIISASALRKLRRKQRNEELAKEARFWRKERSMFELGYTKPVNQQAARDLSHKRRK